MNHETDTLIELPFSSPRPVLAVGAELKNTLCVLEGNAASITPGGGGLTDASAYRQFRRQLEDARRRCADPRLVIAHDLHPASLATQGVEGWDHERIGVQHHHAHIVSCMAEHGVSDPVIGICCDGTGFGSDGAIWGGEVLLATPTDFERRAHFQYFGLPGGDAAARDTWRPALSLIHQAFDGDLPESVRNLFQRIDAGKLGTVEAMLRADFNCPRTSSLGRLFDAVAFLAGFCDCNETEGQAAIRLEQAATKGRVEPYPFRIVGEGRGSMEIIWIDMIRAMGDRVEQDEQPEMVASRFHETVAAMLGDAAAKAAEYDGTDVAVLSGGCFFNRILTHRLRELLLERGFRRVLVPSRLSPGDAGLSLGQAVVAAARLRERT